MHIYNPGAGKCLRLKTAPFEMNTGATHIHCSLKQVTSQGLVISFRCFVAGMVGFEPTTNGLTVRCSTAELHPHIKNIKLPRIILLYSQLKIAHPCDKQFYGFHYILTTEGHPILA